MSRYWLTPAPDEQLDEKIADVNAVYREAFARAAQGERTLSTDEATGVQALERAAPTLLARRRKVERQEFEYVRLGTLSFMVNFDVATGQVVAPSCGPTRTARGLRCPHPANDPKRSRRHRMAHRDR